MAESKVIVNPPSPSSPPPNCAICLGSCSNKCFSDSCSHEFCFKCLLEWSKIKAECPLCKQPFKSIIHNVNSTGEFEEHVVETTRSEEIHLIDNDDFLFLPLQHLPTRHEFHVRTTFTVDSRGEHAIQQMLLAHPFTNGRITVGTQYPRTIYPNRHRPRDYSSTFRRSIYSQNLWANTLPDLTGHYRDVSPTFFRNNPGSRQRLVPWLNRELNALLNENTQLVMHLADLIMDHLLRHHICSRTFRNLLGTYLVTKTDHFVHEFYSFMRSPFDMVGYDRRVIYSTRPQSPAPFLEDDTVEIPDNSDDSDAIFVGTTQAPEAVTINLVDSDSDSDEPIMITPVNQVPMPIMPNNSFKDSPSPSPHRSVSINLPAKLRHKNKTLQDKEKWRCLKKRHRCRSRSSSSSASSSDEREKSAYRRYKRKKLLKKIKLKKRGNINSSSDTEVVNVTSDTDDDKPLIDVIKKKWKVRERTVSYKSEKLCAPIVQNDFEHSYKAEPMDLSFNMPGCSRSSDYQQEKANVEYSSSKNIKNSPEYLEENAAPFQCYSTEQSRKEVTKETNSHSTDSGSSTEECSTYPDSKSDLKDKQESAGPSAPVLLRRNQNSWYRVGVTETDSSD
ncbi:E3 ubiquitin-protein ligase Topors-like isoform X2 [Cylas formicarius]|uniref:E3 ubiquitin-protein ligase Topors-like isoform X2 n=1 Tax=Cylas formicarius TaxID=197179 RepID=UPI00295856AB|nr:E3 ubiquitin-protein ligase Topors-like isoform X2 [Cylas formicarius]